MKVEERLELATREVETQIDGVPQRPLSVVQQRNRRHNVMVGAAGATLVILMLAGSAFLLDGSVAEPTMTTPPASSAALGATSINWTAVDSVLGDVRDTASSNGQLYALSTTPGVAATGARQQDAIYTSTDGVTWDRHDVNPDLWISAIDAQNGVLYAVSTAPSTAAAGGAEVNAQVAASTDGGTTWQTHTLPVTASPPSGVGDELYRAVSTDIAAGPAGVLAAVDTEFGMDLAPLVPAEYSGDGFHTYQTTDGIEVIDSRVADEAKQSCEEAAARGADPATAVECPSVEVMKGSVVYTATWDELGIAPPATGFAELFLSKDGNDFEPVASPFSAGGTLDLVATSDGFFGMDVAVTQDTMESRLWFSTDGRDWVRLAAAPDASWIDAVGEVNGDLVAVGETMRQGNEAAAVFTSNDGGATWHTLDLATLADVTDGGYTTLGSADVGPGGVTVGFWVAKTPKGETGTTHVLTTADLETWFEVQLPEGQAGTQPFPGWVLSGDQHTVVSLSTSVGDSIQRALLVGAP